MLVTCLVLLHFPPWTRLKRGTCKAHSPFTVVRPARTFAQPRHERMTVTTYRITIAYQFYSRRHIDWILLLGHQHFIAQFYTYSMYIEGRKDARKKSQSPRITSDCARQSKSLSLFYHLTQEKTRTGLQTTLGQRKQNR